MTCDWVKMRTDLYRDPKVCMIADYLMSPDGDLARYVNQHKQRDMTVTRNVMRNVTVGALVTLWGVTRHRGRRINDDLLIVNATVQVIDDIADLPGLGEAMESVGWAVMSEKGLVLPNFFGEFNSDPNEDAKEKNAERQRRYREKRNALRNVTVTSFNNVREEKSREEKSNKKKPLPPKVKKPKPAFDPTKVSVPDDLASTEFDSVWSLWVMHRKEIRKPLTESQSEAQIAKLSVMGRTRAIAALNHSISNGWQGIFEPDERQATASAPPVKYNPLGIGQRIIG